MAAGHAIAPVTLEHVQNRISDYRYCPFDLEEYWDSILPTSVSRSLITQLVENYDVSKRASYCQLITDIENTLRIHPGREDYIVKIITDFVSPPRLVPLHDTDMARLPESNSNRKEKHRNSRKSKKSEQAERSEILNGCRDSDMDDKLRARNNLHSQRVYNEDLNKHRRSAIMPKLENP